MLVLFVKTDKHLLDELDSVGFSIVIMVQHGVAHWINAYVGTWRRI